MTPAQAVAHAVQRDAADDDEITAQHTRKVEARAHYRDTRLSLIAGLILCDSRAHNRTIRPCETCRADVRAVNR